MNQRVQLDSLTWSLQTSHSSRINLFFPYNFSPIYKASLAISFHINSSLVSISILYQNMASHGNGLKVSVSPKNGGNAEAASFTSPKGRCLCSPTTHQGSFRCRFHRSQSSTSMKRSKSMPSNNNSVASFPPTSVHDQST